MATNRAMLKEAIADAKAVKETAIANAKAALEEAFTPQLKSMLSLKLQEMEMEEEELEEAGFGDFDTKENTGFNKGMDKALDEEDKDMMEVDLEELLAELNDEEEEAQEAISEAEEDEESEEVEDEGEPLDLEDMTDEDLKDMIEDVIKDMIASGELEAGEGEEEEEGEEMEMSDEEVDLAELLREIEEMEDVNEDELEEGLLDKIKSFFTGGDFSGVIKPFISQNEKEIADITSMEANSDERTKRANALLNKFEAFAKGAEYGSEGVKRSDRSSLMLLLKGKGLGGKTGSELGADISGLKLKEELDEAYSTIEALKNELNEINLLNAKLLYSNKIFKAKNLNESQKVKVLSSFDKATTVGEVKLVFETLNEGIKVTKNMIKENLGSASKSTVTPTVKKPIVESNDAFLRMQKLAGLI